MAATARLSQKAHAVSASRATPSVAIAMLPAEMRSGVRPSADVSGFSSSARRTCVLTMVDTMFRPPTSRINSDASMASPREAWNSGRAISRSVP